MSKPKPRKQKEADVAGGRYFNRELSWLRFNERVLDEARNPSNPLLERVKFLSIFESNLDEFYMVRVSGLIEQSESGIGELSPDGCSADEQLRLIQGVAHPMRSQAARMWSDQIAHELSECGIRIRPISEFSVADLEHLDDYFMREVFPVCTPLLLDPAPNVPFISNRSLNLAVVLQDADGTTRLGRVKIPSVVPRLVRINKRRLDFVLLESLVERNLHHLFPGVELRGAYPFRVLRDADIEIRELEAADLVASLERTLRLRRFGDPVLLQVTESMPESVRKTLIRLLLLDKEDVMEIPGLLALEGLWELAGIDKPALKFSPHQPYVAEPISNGARIFETVAKQDVMVCHPYDSFLSVEEFVASAAKDPSVIGIKQSLYRVGEKSPIVESLMDAAASGKQVAAMVELKARFDESNNLEWARALERAGVHVTYGFAELKTHAKLCLIVRREAGGIRTYAHIGTGNYNPATARIYTDIGLFTSDPEITQDISELFNFLTGFSKQREYRKLVVAPINLREEILRRIRREIDLAKKGKRAEIMFKLNSLVDPEVIDALYEASAVGIPINLIVRGICCVRPGVPGLSENIHVRSVVGRFLEHSRAYYFANGGTPDMLIGSADLMRRNLDRRVETLVPVKSASLIELTRKLILSPALRDNTNAWVLQPDGSYMRLMAATPNERFSSQAYSSVHPLSQAQFKA